MSLSQNLSQHWSNNWMLKVRNNVMELNGISLIATAGPVVRNDEAVGSIPTSSTKCLNPRHTKYQIRTPKAVVKLRSSSRASSICRDYPARASVLGCAFDVSIEAHFSKLLPIGRIVVVGSNSRTQGTIEDALRWIDHDTY